MAEYRVIHLIDTLDLGGAERVAVELSNGLAEGGHHVTLCASRRSGPLSDGVATGVHLALLDRRHRLDPRGLERFHRLIRDRRPQIIHAHGTSLFLGALMARTHGLSLVWHVHSGRRAESTRARAYRWALRGGRSAVLTVSEPLAHWARNRLGVDEAAVGIVPNFVHGRAAPSAALDQYPRPRLICVANLRPEKDQGTLLQAMARLATWNHRPPLLLVGSGVEQPYGAAIRRMIVDLGLAGQVVVLGKRRDARSLIASCDIGLLSSASEGLPVALLEYGAAGLAVVVTAVGQCPRVVDGGRAGLVVQPGQPEAMAAAMRRLLEDPPLRQRLGRALADRIRRVYTREAALEVVEGTYERVCP